ncbi:MAG TPA: histone deacetylase [Candidatus Brocadiales bacterium]|nr:histone deacetylase [Candidatus Brocadiales bacterium]
MGSTETNKKMAMLIYDDIFLEHDTGYGHPESALRLKNTVAYLKASGVWEKLRIKKPRMASFDEICAVHDAGYVKSIEQIAQRGGDWLDADTCVSGKSWEAALYAAGAPLTAIDEIMQPPLHPPLCKGGIKREGAFCLVRPPGHHATPTRGMGFCLFNNVAIAAKYLQRKYTVERVLIVDWDVHHGNGTQDAFYEDPSVLYFSMHRYPFYPGTGRQDETGRGKGKGFTINVPLSSDTDRGSYIKIFKDIMETRVRQFRPQFILISAGFDAYKHDPIGGLGLELEDFYKLTKITMGVANACCNGRIVSCLEGGYHPTDLPKCIEQHLMALIEQG